MEYCHELIISREIDLVIDYVLRLIFQDESEAWTVILTSRFALHDDFHGCSSVLVLPVSYRTLVAVSSRIVLNIMWSS